MQNTNQNNARLEVIKASEIEPKEIEWLWYPFIPYGKVTLLQGDPGDGKSTFMLTIAALLTRGEPLPFTDTGKPHEPISVIYQTTEDDADDGVMNNVRFDELELMLMAMFEQPTLKDTIQVLTEVQPLVAEDAEMAALVQQTIPKMQQLNEQQFKGLELEWHRPEEADGENVK